MLYKESLKKGQTITNWLYAGPFILNAVDGYQDNYHVSEKPYLHLIKQGKEKTDLRPTEGDSIELFNHKVEWKKYRANQTDTKVTFPKNSSAATFMLTYVYNKITVPDSGLYNCSLWLSGNISLYINGKLIFETYKPGNTGNDYNFDIPLQAGENHCMILLTNIHLLNANSFSMYINKDCETTISLLSPDIQERMALENDFEKFYLADNIIKENEPVVVYLDESLNYSGEYVFTVYNKATRIETYDKFILEKRIKIENKQPQNITICNFDEINYSDKLTRDFTIHISYISENGIIHGSNLSFSILSCQFVDYIDDFDTRKKTLLQIYSKMQTKDKVTGVYYQIAKLEAKRFDLFDEKEVETSIDYINSRYDCSDFAMHGLLRLYYKYKDSNLLSNRLKEKIKRCILDFKYSEDEPGKSMMFTRSENHEMLFYSAEYLAGLLFPCETFTNSNQNGLFHALKGKINAERWIKEKGNYGFKEWHSNCYYEEDMLALLNLYDFSETNGYIRFLSGYLLDFICFLIATQNFNGILATTHGRSYENMIMHPELESMSHINWLLFGKPNILTNIIKIGAMALINSNYTPPKEFQKIANSKEELYTISSMGLNPYKGIGCVNCATYRTKDYMVSGMIESNKGEFGQQVHAGQATLDGNIPVFVTCFDNKSEITRPSYWGGQFRNPKTILTKNVLAYIYNIDDVKGFTHCYFPFSEFDKTIIKGNWLFGCKNDSYIAVFSSNPYSITKHGQYKNKELLCNKKQNIWLFELDSKENYSSFDLFIESIENAELTIKNENLIYHSPSVGILKLGYNISCTVNDKPILDEAYPLIHNKYAHSEVGSGIIKFVINNTEKILNFNI